MSESLNRFSDNADQGEASIARVPKAVIGVCLLVIFVGVVLLVAGAVKVGATWDEYGLGRFLQSYFDNGWFTEPSAVVGGTPDLDRIWFLYSYGPAGMLVGHLVASIAGADVLGSPQLTSEAIAYRHLGSALMAIVGVTAVAGTVGIITKSRAWAVLGAAALISVPLWVGHGSFNPKDVPVATAYALGTLAATAMCQGDVWSTWRRRLLVGFALVLGLVLGAGTRPFIGFVIAGSVFAALLFRTGWAWWGGLPRGPAWRPFVDLGAACVIAYALLLMIYPRLFSDPISLGIGSYLEARQFAFNEYQLVAGRWVSEPVPRWFLPVWLSAQLPALILIGTALGVISWVAVALSARRTMHRTSWEAAAVFPAIVQAFAAAGLAFVMGAVIYNGSRQYLFAIPALVVIGVYGLYSVARWARLRMSSRWVAPLWWSLIVLGLLVPTVAQVQLFPYGYTFLNGATVLVTGVDGAWPTDYWRASDREMYQRLPVLGNEGCAYEQGLWGRAAPCSNEQMFLPYAEERGIAATASAELNDGYWVLRENQGVVATPAGCRVADSITRWNLWEKATIAQILECPLDTPFQEFTYGPGAPR